MNNIFLNCNILLEIETKLHTTQIYEIFNKIKYNFNNL